MLTVLGGHAHAHDPSAWGGIFRSRDFGTSWLSADAGQYIGGAMALSVHPRDANHLLFATDTRLLRSANGGRDWRPDATDVLVGPVTAVSFDIEGGSAAASSAAGVFYAREGGRWERATAPQEAAPARLIIAGRQPGSFFLSGVKGVFAGTEGGKRFTRLGQSTLPDAVVTALLMNDTTSQSLVAVVAGDIWISADAGENWQARRTGLPAGRIETLTRGAVAGALWAVGADTVYRSGDGGQNWQPYGNPLPIAKTSVRAMAVSDDARTLVLATHRGALRSIDAGGTWAQIEDTLPVHLEAGLMLRDPHDAQTLYTGFALTPYPELYRRAQQGSDLLSQSDTASLLGGAAFLLLMVIVGVMLAKRLMQGR